MLPKPVLEKIEKVAKNKKEKEKLMKMAQQIWEKGQIEPYEAVGVIAAQSMGERATQMTLRVFHMPGVAALNVPRGLTRFIEIVDARKTPGTPMMTIYLKDPKKAEEFAKKIEEVKVKDVADIIEDYAQKTITIKMDEKRLKARGVEVEEVLKAIEKVTKRKVRKGKTVRLKFEGAELRKIRGYALKIADAHVKGVPKIKRAAIFEKDGETIIQTEGSNLAEVLKLPEVDATRTISNDIHEVARVLGIEAARRMILEEGIETLRAQGLNVDIRHMMLVADLMTMDGEVKAVGRTGVMAEKESVFARAAFEETTKHLLDAALQGTVDNLRGVTENIIIGQLMPIGTGLVKLALRR